MGLDFFVNSLPHVLQALTRTKQTVLHAAVAGSANASCIRLLMSIGMDENAKDSTGRSPLFYIFRNQTNSRLDLLRVLLEEFDADTTIINEDGQSFIAEASMTQDCQEIMDLLSEFEN